MSAKRIALVALIVASLGFFTQAFIFAKIIGEGKARRNQNCQTFELAHADEIESLKNTYDFLTRPRVGERNPDLYALVVRELPQLEREAKSDTDKLGPRVPEYCDRANTGLKEPDPIVPKRPSVLDDLPK